VSARTSQDARDREFDGVLAHADRAANAKPQWRYECASRGAVVRDALRVPNLEPSAALGTDWPSAESCRRD
jgi:hypothetical protein